MEQTTLIINKTKKTIEFKTLKQLQEEKEMKEFPIELCKKRILEDEYLWDLRAWRKNHDEKEVTEWITKNPIPHKNCGHAGYCIRILKDLHKIPIKEITKIILQNNKVKYKKEQGTWFFCSICQKPITERFFSWCDKCSKKDLDTTWIRYNPPQQAGKTCPICKGKYSHYTNGLKQKQIRNMIQAKKRPDWRNGKTICCNKIIKTNLETSENFYKENS